MVIWLVRHGESTWNALGLAQGHCDHARLTRRGEQQARVVAAQLRSRPIGALYASDLRRALQTAAPLATALGLPVTRDARLRERCLGVLEGTNAAAIHPTASGLRAHRVVDADARPPGGESLREFYRRVAEFADDLPALGDPAPWDPALGDPALGDPALGDPALADIAVVAHGGTLRVLNAYLRGIPVERMSWEPLANGCILRWPAWRLDHITSPSERESK